MADENNCCKCTTPEITIKLNKQGPQGLSGPPGEAGFSPVINVAENTSESYKLNITTIDGSYETPNLKANIPSGGVEGTVLTKNSSVSGDASFKPLPYATDTDAGVVAFATQEDIEGGSSNLAVNSSSMVNYYTKTQADNKYVDLTSNQLISGLKRFNDGLSTPNIYSPGTSRNILAREMVGADTFRVYLGDTAKTTEVVINTPELNQYFDGANHKVLTEDDIATTSVPGIVQPDGTTITINDGVISAVGGGGGSSYTAGNGINIYNNVISFDTTDNQYVDGNWSFENRLNLTSIRALSNSSNFTISNNSGNIAITLTPSNGCIFGINGKNTIISTNEYLTISRNYDEYVNIDSGNLSSYLPTATSSSLGVVQPDNTTIDIDSNGVISVDPTGLTTLAKTDMSNLTNTGTTTIANLPMPSGVTEELVFGASSTTYTAPADGYFIAYRVPDVNGCVVALENTSGKVRSETSSPYQGTHPTVWVPVQKGQTVTLEWTGGASENGIWFTYSEGSKWEAQ